MIHRGAFFAALLALTPAYAQSTNPSDAARAAAAQLEQAAETMRTADSGRDRVAALTEAVQAFEAGLAATRDGMRRAAIREDQLTRELAARDAEIGRLLGALQAVGTAPTPLILLHPDGPTGSARAGMLLSELTPALTAQADDLRNALKELATLRSLQTTSTETLQAGLQGVQNARSELATAVSDRTDLPQRFTDDPVRTAILIDSASTLDSFAAGLPALIDGPIEAAQPDIAALKGTLILPVQGQIILRSGDTDAAGVTRPGVVLATRPGALVATPTAATVRYVGSLLDLGTVVILEPQDGLLFVLSGLGQVYVTAGQVLPQNAPLGLMGGNPSVSGTIASTQTEGAGTILSETLYIEVRQDNDPVDPMQWFQSSKD
jgi:septal ring factor EnvC (AmiA/AmiB activator)